MNLYSGNAVRVHLADDAIDALEEPLAKTLNQLVVVSPRSVTCPVCSRLVVIDGPNLEFYVREDT